jgi:TolA-binding protein
VNTTAKAAAVVTVALLAAVTLTGCGSRAGSGAQSPGGASVAASSSASATVAPGAAPAAAVGAAAPAAGGKAGLSQSDVNSLNQQLDAMQKEIDGLKMPSDSDYSGAASAVY